jgi:hypothetical protein
VETEEMETTEMVAAAMTEKVVMVTAKIAAKGRV